MTPNVCRKNFFQMSSFRTLSKCRVCFGNFELESLVMNPTPLANNLVESKEAALVAQTYPLEVVLCSNCKHYQLKHIVCADELFENYLYASGASKFFVNHFKNLAELIKSISSKPYPKILEIGSNDGVLLDHLSGLGFNSLGVEPSLALVQQCRQRGLNIIHGFLDSEKAFDILSKYGKFDFVVANNVFAHIDDLVGTFKLVHNLLRDDGFVIFEVADFAEIPKRGIFDSIYHEHMSYHTLSGLSKLLHLSGFVIKNFEEIDSHGGSLRIFLQKGIHKTHSPGISARIELEHESGLVSPQVLGHISKEINERKKELLAWQLRRNTERLLFGYGAPAKVVTFLSEMDLGNIGIQAIVDDNCAKQNLFLPTFGIPIISSQELIAKHLIGSANRDGMDVLIFPWNLSDEIIAKIKKWPHTNIKIITFFPNIKETLI